MNNLVRSRRFFALVIASLATLLALLLAAVPSAHAQGTVSENETNMNRFQNLMDGYSPADDFGSNSVGFSDSDSLSSVSQPGIPSESSTSTLSRFNSSSAAEGKNEQMADSRHVVTSVSNNATIDTAPTKEGAQSIITLHNSQAPKEYSFGLNLQAGSHAETNEDGSISVKDRSGAVTWGAKAPWAKDASGRDIPTQFEIHGDVVTQKVLTDDATNFPVTADPSWWKNAATAGACAAELGGFAVGGAKVAQAFSKSEKVIKGSKKLADAYEKLGGKMDKVIEALKDYFVNSKNMSQEKVDAISTLLKAGGGTIVGILGIGSCYDLGKEFLGWPEIGG